MTTVGQPGPEEIRRATPAQQNAWVIEQFRANGGALPGEGSPALLLLHHVGARTGARRVTPVTFRVDAGRHVIFASYAGGPAHPTWFHNLVAHPRVTYEVGVETFEARARVVEGEEHKRLWTAQKAEFPVFADYETSAAPRVIPVVILERDGPPPCGAPDSTEGRRRQLPPT